MLWFLVLPLYLSLATLGLGAIALLLWAPPKFKWLKAAFLAIVAFVPLVVLITLVLHPFRFGEFTYDNVAQIQDTNVEWNLPLLARDITVIKGIDQNHARYQLTLSAFHAHLATLWQGAAPVGEFVTAAEVKHEFQAWPALANARRYRSPPLATGAVTFYFYDANAGVVYSTSGYW